MPFATVIIIIIGSHRQRGDPLRQPGMPTTGSLGPFSADAEGDTVADLLCPRARVAAATGDQPSTSSLTSFRQYTEAEVRCIVLTSPMLAGSRTNLPYTRVH